MVQRFVWLQTITASALLLCSSAAVADDGVTTDQLKALTASIDRLNASNAEIIRRLDGIERRSIPQMRSSVDTLTSSQMATLQQMQQLRNQIANMPKAAAAPAKPAGPKLPIQIDIGPGRMVGDPSTTVVLVMYSDYQCPFCAKFLNDTYPKLKEEFIDTNRIRFAARDFVLPAHKDAPRGAIAARCAEDQGKFWEMHMSMNGHTNDVSTRSLESQAKNLGLDVEQFAACLAGQKHENDARLDRAKGVALGFTGTPSFAIGYSKPGESQITVTRTIVGNKHIDNYRAGILEVLDKPNGGLPPAAE